MIWDKGEVDFQRSLDKKRSSQSAFDYINLLGRLALEQNDGKQLGAYDVIMDAIKYSFKDELNEGEQIVYSSLIGEIAVKQKDGTIMKFSSLSLDYSRHRRE